MIKKIIQDFRNMENNYSNKFTGTFTYALRTLILMLFLFSFTNSFAQDPVFKDPTRLSGQDKKQGAVYKYTNIKEVNGIKVDAIVTLTKISNAVLETFDNATNGNLPDRFQPEIYNLGANGGYVEFKFEFFESGTYPDNPKIVTLDKFVLDVVDLDGSEFFDIDIPSTGSYDLEEESKVTATKTGTTTRFLGPEDSVNVISLLETLYIAKINLVNISSTTFRLGNTQ